MRQWPQGSGPPQCGVIASRCRTAGVSAALPCRRFAAPSTHCHGPHTNTRVTWPSPSRSCRDCNPRLPRASTAANSWWPHLNHGPLPRKSLSGFAQRRCNFSDDCRQAQPQTSGSGLSQAAASILHQPTQDQFTFTMTPQTTQPQRTVGHLPLTHWSTVQCRAAAPATVPLTCSKHRSIQLHSCSTHCAAGP